jgi:hypothetical protein
MTRPTTWRQSARRALYRALIKKGLLTREEATNILLDEAVARAIQAEAQQGPEVSATTIEIDRQCAEILKFIYGFGDNDNGRFGCGFACPVGTFGAFPDDFRTDVDVVKAGLNVKFGAGAYTGWR